MVTNRIDMNIIRYSLPVEGTLLMAICLHQAVLLYFCTSGGPCLTSSVSTQAQLAEAHK